MTDGKDVREAFDGPTIEHDSFIAQLEARKREERERSSDASESAAAAKEYIEDTGLNSKVYGWSKAIIKTLDKKDGQHKAMDIIRSLEAVTPLLRDHVAGQGTVEMDLDDDGDGGTASEAVEPDETVTPIDFGSTAAE
jgi:hypothetical protein